MTTDSTGWGHETVLDCLNGVFSMLDEMDGGSAPLQLWHYTNAEALLNIVQSRTMYFTHYRYLNDSAEVVQFTDISREIALEELGRLGHDRPLDEYIEVKSFDDLVLNFWSIVAGERDLTFQYAAYIASFSEDNDLLGQWRAYADDGHGYSIGFSVESILDSIQTGASFRLYRVLYDPNNQRAVARYVMGSILTKCKSHWEIAESDKDKQLVVENAIFMLRMLSATFAPMFKHPAFADEREWRLVVLGRGTPSAAIRQLFSKVAPATTIAKAKSDISNIKVRNRMGSLVLFTTMELGVANGEHPVNEIRLGPKNDMDCEREALHIILHSAGLWGKVKLSESSVPMR